jgi:hypothetical protein
MKTRPITTGTEKRKERSTLKNFEVDYFSIFPIIVVLGWVFMQNRSFIVIKDISIPFQRTKKY